MVKIGVIGGSGLDNLDIFQQSQEKEVLTPYGKPSSSLKYGNIQGVEVILLARHGREHTIPPTQVNFRANIHALKQAGCTHILASTAVGSLKQEVKPGDLVILDQFIDFTRHRQFTFHQEFEPGQAKHTPMAEPFSDDLRKILSDSCDQLNLVHHKKGTVATIEGPRFSTKAESHMFRQWGADVINMTVSTEAILANEVAIPYAAIAMSTDYDCWKEDEEPVTWDAIMQTFKTNADNVTKLLINVIPKITNSSSIKDKIRTIPNWPKPGIMFRDITTLLQDPEGFKETVDLFYERYKDYDIDAIAGIESRGFIFGSVLANKLGVSFVLIRKPGKLPSETISQEYAKEYGLDKVEVHKDAVSVGSKVLLIDDLIATGGTALAAGRLMRDLGAQVVECTFVIDLPDLGGMKKLEQDGFKTHNLIEFEGE